MNREEKWLLEERYGGEKSAAFFTACKRLAAGEPLAYIIGYVPFLNCTIYLDSHPLIPRSETEYWTQKAIQEIKKVFPENTGKVGEAAPRPPKILDLCAGSGCIGVAVAKAIPSAEVTFSELDKKHLNTIKKNISLNLNSAVNSSIQVCCGDLFEKLNGRYDFILSNPPYIDPTLDRTESSVKDFEPHLALYGGKGGLAIIERIIEGARASLAPLGQLWLEHEPEQVTTISDMAIENKFQIATHTDQYGLSRYSIITMAELSDATSDL